MGLRRAGFELRELLRVEAGSPRMGQDLDERTIPLEARLEHAISYDKGCYIGQEVIARATFRGQVNRLLTGISLGQATAATGSELFDGEKKVGTLTSVVRAANGETRALAYVHRDHQEPGTALTLAGQGPIARVVALPFVGGA
jgi:aminomethyltransferase